MSRPVGITYASSLSRRDRWWRRWRRRRIVLAAQATAAATVGATLALAVLALERLTG